MELIITLDILESIKQMANFPELTPLLINIETDGEKLILSKETLKMFDVLNKFTSQILTNQAY